MKETFDVIEKLRATSSSKDKLAILTAAKDNVGLKEFLRMTYEPRINFYMTKVDTKSKSSVFDFRIEKFSPLVMRQVLETLGGRQKTGDAARRWVNDLYHALETSWEKELLELLIQRDVKAGISKGTINKVWPGLVTDVPYMRCTLPDAVDLDSWPWHEGVFSEIKADGQFANVSHHERTGNVTIESRNGSPMPLEYFGSLVEVVKAFVPVGQQLHGELLIKHKGKILPRAEGNGIFNSLLQGGELPADHEVVYHAWDTIPVSEAKAKNKYPVQYKHRFALLKEWFGGFGAIQTEIEIIEHKMVFSIAEAYAHAVEAMELGLEGTVIKHPHGIWEDSDGSKNQVKLKLQIDFEVRVVGFKDADKKSKNKDLFGSLMCESECGKFRVNVSGIKDDKRKELFNRKDEILGKLIITISNNGLQAPTASNGGYWSCFLPRFQEERLDKTAADTLVRMKEIQAEAIKMGAIYGKGAKKKK